MENTKVVRKRKFNFLKLVIFILLVYFIFILAKYALSINIKNIIILNNYYLTDEEIIEASEIEDYPSFIKTSKNDVNKKLLKNPLIKEVKIKKKFPFIFEITIIENKILFKSRSNELYYLSDYSTTELNISGLVPVLINFVPNEVNEKLIKKMSVLDIDIISKISEIEYTPTNYDAERFLLYMIDGNEVYITLSKTNRLNKYIEIVKTLEGHKGILYLDSGNYFEIKD